jgi:F-type H+-transporting ATPase subunit delta
MQNPRLAARYAKSLIDIAKESNVLDAVLNDMQLLHNTISSSKELALTIASPIIKGDKKSSILKAIFGDKLQNVTVLFIDLLINKGREANLNEITSSFIAQYKTLKQVHVVQLTTATPLDNDLKELVASKVAAEIKSGTVEIATQVQEDLIGGFVLQVGDKLFDASVKRDLLDVKNQFTKNIYVADI